MGRAVRALAGLGFRFALLAAAILLLYGGYLVKRLDVSRESVEARARSVEADVVPARVAGADGRAFDAALEVPLSLSPERIPDFVKHAFIVREDQLFRWHFGFNPVALYRAARTNRDRAAAGTERRVGGSTITMQLVKNLLLSQEQTLDRKINEAILAVIVEIIFSKDEILAMYLNTAYFGDGAYGIETAARRFFGRSVGFEPKLNALEAAMLAHSVRRPSYLNPTRRPKELERRGRELLASMEAEGYPVPAGTEARGRGERAWRLDAHLFRDVAMRSMVPAELKARQDRLVLGFTVDTEAQLYAELAATDLLKRGRAAGYDSSAIIVMQADGAIVALATGHDYDGIDLVRNGRVSPGSTLKPFLFLCALEKGLTPGSVVKDEKREFRPGWTPRNFDGKYLGAITLDEALKRSRNASAVELYDRFGHRCFDDVLRRYGIALDDPRTPTAVLGSEHTSLLDLAAAYAGLASGGRSVEPYAVRYARTRKGQIVFRQTRAEPAPPGADRAHCELLSMLRNVTRAGGTGHNAAFSHPVWGKTGTSQRYRDALFAGFTGHYVAVVWLGRQAKGDVSAPITGGELPAEAFRWLMATLHEGRAPKELTCRAPVRVAAGPGALN